MILDSIYPAQGGGGAENQVSTLTHWFSERGQPSVIIVPMLPWGPLQASERHGQVEISRLRYPRVPLLGAMVLQLRLAWTLLRRRHEIRALHCHIGSNMAITTCLVNRLLKKPMLLKLTGNTELNGGILDRKPSLPMRIKRHLLKQTTIQAISQMIASRLLEAGFRQEQIQLIPNAVDTARFNISPAQQRTARAQAFPDTDLVAIYVGRLEAEKGVDLLIDAWAEAFAADDRVKLVLVGSGALEDALKARARTLGCAHQLEFAGRSNDVSSHLFRADISVLTSHAEGLSNTMLESMASGLPMIGSRVSGNEDFIEPGVNGWLFPAGDRQALVNCLRAAFQLEHARLVEMGQAARHKVETAASVDVVAQKLQKLYDQPRQQPSDTGRNHGTNLHDN